MSSARAQSAGVITAAIVLLTSSFAWAGEYRLEQLINAALKSDRDIRRIQEEITKTDAQIMEAKGGAMPTIKGNAVVQHAFKTVNPYGDLMSGAGGDSAKTASFFNDTLPAAGANAADYKVLEYIGGTLSGFSDFSLTTPPNTMSLSISAEQALFAQGKVSIGLKIAKTYKQTIYCKYDAARQQVVAKVTRLFYGALLARENALTRMDAVSLARQAHQLAVSRLTLGGASALDTLGTALALEMALMEERNAHTDERLALDALARACQIGETAQTLILDGAFVDPEFNLTLDQAVALMETNSKVLGQLQGNSTIQEQLVRLKKSDYLPLVFCGGSVGKVYMFDNPSDIELTGRGTSDAKVYVGASLTLFDGVKRSQRVYQAKSDQRAFALTYEQTLDNLRLGVNSAWETVENNRANLASARSMIALAEQGWALAKRLYETNALTQLELGLRQNELNSARTALNAARFALQSSIIDLQLLMGTLPLE